MRESIVVGIVGENGAGKDLFAQILLNIADFRRVLVCMHRFSDPIAETLDIWGIEKTREHMQNLPVILEDRFGNGLLAKALEKRVCKDEAELILLNGVRWPADLEMLRRFHRNLLVYITAPQETRYARMKTRKEKVGEDIMSYEEFLERDNAINERYISIIGESADWKYENETSLDRFSVNASSFYFEKICSFLFK